MATFDARQQKRAYITLDGTNFVSLNHIRLIERFEGDKRVYTQPTSPVALAYKGSSDGDDYPFAMSDGIREITIWRKSV